MGFRFKRRMVSAAAGTAILFLGLAGPTHARLNLPQRAQQVALSEPMRQKLEAALKEAAAHPSELTATAEAVLVEILPGDFRGACNEMLEKWGSEPKSTARWTADVLYDGRDARQRTAIIAYSCGSSHPDYAGFHDERLAVLRLEPNAATLRLIPLAEDCENCSELYHLGFSRVFSVGDGLLVELHVSSSLDNPCCAGPSRENVEQLALLLLPEARPVLMLERRRERYNHDDEAGDSEEICRAELRYVRNPAGQLEEIVVRRQCRADGKQQPPQMQRYRWQPAARRFEEQKTENKPPSD